MHIERLTAKMQEGLQESQSLASSLQHQEILPEHLLLSLLRQSDGLVRPLLEKLEVRPRTMEEQLELNSQNVRRYQVPRINTSEASSETCSPRRKPR